MPELTPNYGLALYNNTTDATQLFLDWRLDQAGNTGVSNMDIIDSEMFAIQTQITDLEGSKGLIRVASTGTSNTFTATGIAGIVTYVTNTSILLSVSSNVTGAATLNINSIGVKSIQKINSSGTAVALGSGDLLTGRFYIFTYDGTRWVWDNAFSSDQINVVSGISGNFLRTSSGGNMEDSGSSPSTFAVAAKGVTNGDTHDHSGGDGGQIDYNGLSNLPAYNSEIYFKDDFISFNPTTATFSYLYNIASLVSGTFAALPGEANHNGIMRISSSASANSGGYLTSGTTTLGSILLNGSMELNLIFRIPTITSTTIRLGFHNSYTSTAPVDGAWINISAATLDGRTANNSTSSTTGTNYTISANTWYRLNITTDSGLTTITYTLSDVPTTTTLWTNTLTTNIPTARVTNMNFFAIRTTATTAAQLINMDYFDIKYNATR